MTAIVGFFDGGSTWLACDGLVQNGSFIKARAAAKVFRVGDWLVGHAGTAWFPRALAEFPGLGVQTTASEFCWTLRKALADIGFRPNPKDDEEGLPDFQNELILARPRECWYTGLELSPMPVGFESFCAIGSGGLAAISAAWGAREHGATAEEAVVTGIRGASTFQTGIGGSIACAHVQPDGSFGGPVSVMGLRTSDACEGWQAKGRLLSTCTRQRNERR